MTAPKNRDEVADAGPESPAPRVTGVGLSPAVEKMFGALIDEQAAAAAQSTAEPKARRASRPGAA